MRKLLLVLAAGVLALSGCSTGEGAVDVNNGGEFRFVAGTPGGQVIPVEDRATAPEFAGTLLDGEPYSSADFAGDVAVINFWASWCGPCRTETPEFQELYAETRDRGVQFLGINVKDDAQLARAFFQRFEVEFPSLFDPRSEVVLAFRDYPANAIPSTVVLDREGRVAAVYTTAVQQDDLRATVDRILAEDG